MSGMRYTLVGQSAKNGLSCIVQATGNSSFTTGTEPA